MKETVSTSSPEQEPINAASVERSEYNAQQTFLQVLRENLGLLPVVLTLAAIVAYFAVTTGGNFLAPNNLSNMLGQIVTIGVTGLGVALVLLLGEIDLSVAAVGTLGAVVTAILITRNGLDPWLAIGAGILVGAAAGLLNGIFIAILRVPSFIVTLAASIAYGGLILSLLDGQTALRVRNPAIDSLIGILPDIWSIGLPTFLLLCYTAGLLIDVFMRNRKGLRTPSPIRLVIQIAVPFIVVEGAVLILMNTPSPTPGLFLAVPTHVAIMFCLIFFVWLLITKTRFGRYVYAVGGNSEAARRTGISVIRIRITVFTLCSALAAVGGILALARGRTAYAEINSTLLMSAIAAAVIGGVSLFGGRGSVWAVALGALILGSLENGLSLRGQETDIKQMVQGSVLLLAVTIDALVRRVQIRKGNDTSFLSTLFGTFTRRIRTRPHQ